VHRGRREAGLESQDSSAGPGIQREIGLQGGERVAYLLGSPMVETDELDFAIGGLQYLRCRWDRTDRTEDQSDKYKDASVTNHPVLLEKDIQIEPTY
jgi:hypothetical protein